MKLRFIIFTAFTMLVLVSGENLTKSSPAPSPDLPLDAADSPPIPSPETPHSPSSSPPLPSNHGSPSPAESPIDYTSPPQPESHHSSPSPSPSPSDLPLGHGSTTPPSSTPSPNEASDYNHEDIKGIEEKEEKKSSSSGGMSGATKAGVAFGTIAAVCVVGLAGFVYKKRQDNIRRSRYGYAARDIL